jgi:hypothetical protein
VLVLLCSGPMREQDQNDMTHYGFRRRQPRRDRRHRRARTARRTPALGAVRLRAADRLSLRGQGPDRIYHRVFLRPAARPAAGLARQPRDCMRYWTRCAAECSDARSGASHGRGRVRHCHSARRSRRHRAREAQGRGQGGRHRRPKDLYPACSARCRRRLSGAQPVVSLDRGSGFAHRRRVRGGGLFCLRSSGARVGLASPPRLQPWWCFCWGPWSCSALPNLPSASAC